MGEAARPPSRPLLVAVRRVVGGIVCVCVRERERAVTGPAAARAKTHARVKKERVFAAFRASQNVRPLSPVFTQTARSGPPSPGGPQWTP